MTIDSEGKNRLSLFAAMFAAVFGLIYAFLNIKNKSSNSQKSTANLDNISSILLELKDCFVAIQPALNFEETYKRLKQLDGEGNKAKSSSFIDDKIAENEMMWKRFHNIDLAFSDIILHTNTKESFGLQKTKEQLGKFWQLPGMLKNTLVIRGKILRLLKKLSLIDMPLQQPSQTGNLKITALMKEFNEAKNLASQEVAQFQKTIKA